jgi:hypothetical protein
MHSSHVRINTWEAHNACWHRTQQIRNKEGGSYSKCSKCPPCIRRHAIASHGILACTRRNMFASMVATAAWNFAVKSSMSVGGSLWKISFRCPQRKKSRGLRSGDLAGHDTGPPRPSHLSGNYAEVVLGLRTKMRRRPIALKPYVTSNCQWHIFKQHR